MSIFEVKISNSDASINISYDFNGNLYATYLNTTDQLCIEDNALYFDKDDFSIIDNHFTKVYTLSFLGNIKKQNENMKIKINKKKYTDFENDKYFSEDDEYVITNEENKNYINTNIINSDIKHDSRNRYADKFKLSDLACDDDIFEDNVYDDCVKFYSDSNTKIQIHERNNGEYLASYDTILCKGSIDDKKIVFKSSVIEYTAPHRVMLYSDGNCCIKQIENKKETHYVVKVNESNNILLERL